MPQDLQAHSVFSSSDGESAEDGRFGWKGAKAGPGSSAQPTQPLFQQCKAEMIKHAMVPLVCRSDEFPPLLLHSSPPPSVMYTVGSAAHPFSPFWFTVEPQDTLAIRGNSALLNCSAHSDTATPARIEWKKDGTFMSLVSDERRHILPDGSLFFTHVVHSKHNKPDEGTYQCVATIDNLGSISSRTARLAVA
ncbi:neogenin-like, partial [Stegastes partitus]|uniref:Neogenin-like n=1 Tax=Stegastes partitus TaxID=144197 RepID=A0A9Y4TWR5_9TELE